MVLFIVFVALVLVRWLGWLGTWLVRLKLHNETSKGRRRVRIGAEDSGAGGIIIAKPRPTDVASVNIADLELVG